MSILVGFNIGITVIQNSTNMGFSPGNQGVQTNFYCYSFKVHSSLQWSDPCVQYHSIPLVLTVNVCLHPSIIRENPKYFQFQSVSILEIGVSLFWKLFSPSFWPVNFKMSCFPFTIIFTSQYTHYINVPSKEIL